MAFGRKQFGELFSPTWATSVCEAIGHGSARKIPIPQPIKKKHIRMRRTLTDSKKDARKFRASFNFVLYRSKQDIWAPNVAC